MLIHIRVQRNIEVKMLTHWVVLSTKSFQRNWLVSITANKKNSNSSQSNQNWSTCNSSNHENLSKFRFFCFASPITVKTETNKFWVIYSKNFYCYASENSSYSVLISSELFNLAWSSSLMCWLQPKYLEINQIQAE
jgi:hypothetical protein